MCKIVDGGEGCAVRVAGSGGFAISQYFHPFIQEVVASTTAVHNIIPHTDVVIEPSGEDAKKVFYRRTEQRMNLCRRKGAFIDQMAALLETDAAGLNEPSRASKFILLLQDAAFLQSDVQPLV